MKYIAMTLGPITETLQLGRKTSEIWMASYLFSSYMKKVIKEIKGTNDANFLVPYVDDDSIFTSKDDGVGKFHDRFIFITNNLTLEDVAKILQKQKDAFSAMVAKSIKKEEAKVKAFFDSYLQTYLFESDKEFSNPIIDISDILDSIELHTPSLEADEDYLRLFLNRDILLNSDLARESFGKKPSFRAIDAIAAQECNETEDEFKATNAKRYIAIIHADGDNLGKYIKAQSNASQVSKKLFEFDKKAVKSIEEFGALALFVGGDDLLIFSPVVKEDREETLFDLIKQLSKDYEEALGTTESTLSFGVSITYYKYPLYEALEKSKNALFSVAKNYKNGTNEKNAVAISAQKHSGQSFEFCLAKDEESYEKFTYLIDDVLGKDIELPHALHHKLVKHKKLFESIPKERLQDSFDNLFNEDMHKDKFEDGLKKVRELFASLGLEQESQEKLFSMLSTIKLLRGDR